MAFHFGKICRRGRPRMLCILHRRWDRHDWNIFPFTKDEMEMGLKFSTLP
jgi:hypothetical protein